MLKLEMPYDRPSADIHKRFEVDHLNPSQGKQRLTVYQSILRILGLVISDLERAETDIT